MNRIHKLRVKQLSQGKVYVTDPPPTPGEDAAAESLEYETLYDPPEEIVEQLVRQQSKRETIADIASKVLLQIRAKKLGMNVS